MQCWKTSLFVPVLLFTLATTVAALDPLEPNDTVYGDLRRWYQEGHIGTLPEITPYPVQVLTKLLEEARASIDAQVSRDAANYLEQLGQRGIAPAGYARAAISTEGTSLEFGPELRFDFPVLPTVWVRAKWSGVGYVGPRGFVHPAGTNAPYDLNFDDAYLGPEDTTLNLMQNVRTMTAIGSDTLVGTASISRLSYGPFGNSVVLSGDAPSSPNFRVTWLREKLVVELLYMELFASTDTGVRANRGKHMMLHSVVYNPTRTLRVGAFQSLVWGPTFDLTYFLPFTMLYYQQSRRGARENAFLGFQVGYRAPSVPVSMDAIFYADDLHFNDVVRLRIDTRYKVALEAGIRWLPALPYLSFVEARYLAVMPYVYTHNGENGSSPDGIDPGAVNYLDYTTFTRNLAIQLPPNSDRWSMRAEARPTEYLRLGIFYELLRHGNASENLPGAGDGTIFDPGFDGGEYAFWQDTPFLTQSVIEYTNKVGTEVNIDIGGKNANLAGRLRYTAEVRRNAGLIAGASQVDHFVELTTIVALR